LAAILIHKSSNHWLIFSILLLPEICNLLK
jgi:hypothetical protein